MAPNATLHVTPSLVMRLCLLLASLLLALPSRAAADEALWQLLRSGGQVIFMRHAITTPGVGDPPGFRLDDCSTQRNLTDTGREDARRVGAAFRTRGIPVGRVLSSPWCRCIETSRLAFGTAEPWAPLSNLFDNRAREAEQMRALREIAGRRPTGGNVVLVTHGSVVQPLTGIQPAPAELVVLTPDDSGRFRLAGRLTP
jgi:broad specificity phosphatase PhoE